MKPENKFQELAINLALESGKIMKRNFVLGVQKEWKDKWVYRE